MPFDAYGAFLIVFVNIAFWLFAIYRRAQGDLVSAYFWWSFFVTIWAVGYGITLGGYFDYETTYFANRLCQVFAHYIGPCFFYLACSLVKQDKKYRRIYLLYLSLASLSAAGLFFTSYYVKGLWSFGPYVYQPLGGPLYSVFVAIFFISVLHGFILVVKSYQKAQGFYRKQIQYFLIGTAVSYVGGATLFVQAYGIKFPSTGVYLLLAYVLFVSYAVLRYKFFDMDTLLEVVRREKLMTMGRLAAGVHHQIKNPLYVIKNVSDIAMEKLNSREDPHAILEATEKYFKTIKMQTEKTFYVLNRFRSFSHHHVTERAKKEAVKLDEVIEDVKYLIQYELQAEGIELRTATLSDVPIFHCDPRHLQEILLNLVHNACEAIVGSGCVDVNVKLHGKYVAIEIADNGPGISSEKTKRIFEPFYTTKSEGTGLGLYIVKELVERNHGKISVRSEEGKGTSFEIAFPVSR